VWVRKRKKIVRFNTVFPGGESFEKETTTTNGGGGIYILNEPENRQFEMGGRTIGVKEKKKSDVTVIFRGDRVLMRGEGGGIGAWGDDSLEGSGPLSVQKKSVGGGKEGGPTLPSKTNDKRGGNFKD